MTPEQLLYTKTHEWVDVQTDSSGAKIATMGLTGFALEALTDLVFIELPDVGRTVAAEESFGEIESVKAVSDLYAPAAGEVIEINSPMIDNPEALSDDPYEAGWLVKIKISDDTALVDLIDYAGYKKQCEEEASEE